MSNLPRMEGLTQQDRVARILHTPEKRLSSGLTLASSWEMSSESLECLPGKSVFVCLRL